MTDELMIKALRCRATGKNPCPVPECDTTCPYWLDEFSPEWGDVEICFDSWLSKVADRLEELAKGGGVK